MATPLLAETRLQSVNTVSAGTTLHGVRLLGTGATAPEVINDGGIVSGVVRVGAGVYTVTFSKRAQAFPAGTALAGYPMIEVAGSIMDDGAAVDGFVVQFGKPSGLLTDPQTVDVYVYDGANLPADLPADAFASLLVSFTTGISS